MSEPVRLEASRAAARHQREWFEAMKARRAAGAPLALVNADTPHDVLRAMGIDYVVNQWWASVVSARAESADYLATLRSWGYPDDSEQYSALSLASAARGLGDDEPWGGLPVPSFVIADASGDAMHKVFDRWREHFGADVFLFESTADDAVTGVEWWELGPERWDELISGPRVDLMAAEIRTLAEWLQARVGTPFDPSALAAAMALSNEQAEWNRRTRDAIAAAPRSPAAIDELIPAVMLPQWHRGTEWGRDAARDLCEEITTRVDGGYARCPEERARLMLIGRGLWGDMGFYRQFEESHGAVFVWSMYLGVAADGYTRRGPDPVRALAARFAAFHDQLYTPPWSSSWYLKEALAHRVDGAVHFVSADSRNSWATTAALEEAGIPVFEIHTDNVDTRTLTPELVREDMRRWLEGPVTEQRRVR